MHLAYFTKARYSGTILAALLLAMAAYALAPAANSRANASPAPDEWDEVFDTARAVLAKLPDAERIEATIKEAGLREAVLRAYRALKACAKVNKSQSTSQKRGFLADFERTFIDVQREAQRSEYQICAANCKIDGARCEQDCVDTKKKLCACKLTEFGCFATKCLFP